MDNLINGRNVEKLKKGLDNFHLAVDDEKINQFLLYYDVLIEWNSFMNLTTITDFEEVVLKHFIDSISLVKAIPDLSEKKYNLIDIGTGAGFPGIPLKIVFPNLKVTLLDSLNKRINFLNEVINKLELKNIAAVHGRAEDYAKPDKLREKYDICVSRAVANMAVLSEYCIPFVKQGGYFAAYKSDKVAEEFESSIKAIDILGGKYEKQVEFHLPFSDIYRNIILIRKNRKTSLKYPRKAGIPGKEPLFHVKHF